MAKLPKETDFSIAQPAEEKEVKPTVFLDIPAGEASGIKLGDTVTVTFKGKVVGTDVHKSSRGKSRAHIDLEDPSVTVESSDNQIKSLDEDLDA